MEELRGRTGARVIRLKGKACRTGSAMSGLRACAIITALMALLTSTITYLREIRRRAARGTTLAGRIQEERGRTKCAFRRGRS